MQKPVPAKNHEPQLQQQWSATVRDLEADLGVLGAALERHMTRPAHRMDQDEARKAAISYRNGMVRMRDLFLGAPDEVWDAHSRKEIVEVITRQIGDIDDWLFEQTSNRA